MGRGAEGQFSGIFGNRRGALPESARSDEPSEVWLTTEELIVLEDGGTWPLVQGLEVIRGNSFSSDDFSILRRGGTVQAKLATFGGRRVSARLLPEGKVWDDEKHAFKRAPKSRVGAPLVDPFATP